MSPKFFSENSICPDSLEFSPVVEHHFLVTDYYHYNFAMRQVLCIVEEFTIPWNMHSKKKGLPISAFECCIQTLITFHSQTQCLHS